MDSITDKVIIRAAEGDMESFETIYRAYSGFVYRIALRMVNNQEDAEEIVQDVFMRVYDQLKNFRFEASLKTWVYRIAVNTTLNFRKKRTRQRSGVAAFREEARHEVNMAKPRYAETEDHNQLINKLLDALSPDQRTCIVLRSIEGLSYQEIADTLEININTVRTRLRRAREKLISLRQEVLNDEL